MIDKIGIAIITMFGIGHIKHAPGTIASFVTCLIFYFFIEPYTEFETFIVLFIVLFFCSIIIIDKLSKYFKKKDPKEIVIDEFFGQLSAFVFFILFFVIIRKFFSMSLLIQSNLLEPIVNNKEITIILFFILFRFFDILKPYPINIIDKKIKKGLGVMLDDIVAGLYTACVMIISLYLYHFLN
jgi:phosphatidylglycerophosphatase A